MADRLNLALIRAVFPPSDRARLPELLATAKRRGAELCVLPELPFDPWPASTPEPSDDSCEPPGGPRHQLLAASARQAGVAVIGGVIVTDGNSRYNTAIVADATGDLVASYRKIHLPNEEGFYETAHYGPGEDLPRRIDAFSVPLGIQICSDVNRPQGTQILAALGAELVVAPRATEAATWSRWRTVLIANAMTSCCWVASVNRPEPERGVAFGGATLVVDPGGGVVVETEEEIAVVEISRDAVGAARQRYPGYLDIFSGLYADGWRAAAR